MDLVLHFRDEALALATYRAFVIILWRGAPTAPRLERAFALIASHAAAIGAPVGKLAIIEDGAPPPLGAELELVQARLRVEPPVIGAMAGAFETRSAGTDVLRETAEGIAGWIGLRFPVRACFDVDEACAWITRRITPDAGPDARHELARAVEHVRGALGPA